MKSKFPISPFSTGLSGSAKEVKVRIQNILRGKRKRPAAILMAGIVAVIATCGMTVFGYSGHQNAAWETVDRALFLRCYEANYGQVYWAEDQPREPQEGDLRLDQVTYLGEAQLGDAIGAAYEVETSWYHKQAGVLHWSAAAPGIEVLRWTQDGTFLEDLGTPNFSTRGLTVEQIIRQVEWNLLDWEASLWREGHDQPIGIGTEVSHIMEVSDGEETIDVLGDEYAAPLYAAGDYYEIHSWADLLTVNCYHSQVGDRCSANHITCLHPDLYTPQGIHVGSTRDQVKGAYPEVRDDPYWQWEGDYLWYQPGGGEFGPAILFLFQVNGVVSDEVQAIVLVNMVN